jgi:hypothetical protein
MTGSRIAALLLSAFVLVTGTFAPSPARAQDDEATLEMARERFKEGVAYFDRKQYAKARAAFLQAYALKPHPAVLLNLAQSELRSGYEADAAKHFTMFLREHDAASPSEREAADAGLASAKAGVHELTLSADAENADVLLDGESIGRTPLRDPVFLSPGKHTLEIRKNDQNASSSVVASAGSATSLELSLKAKPAAPTETPSEAALEPGAPGPDLDMDSEPVVDDAWALTGRKPFFSWLAETPVAWVTTGLTVAGIGTGVGLAVVASQHYDNADVISAEIVSEANADMEMVRGICTRARENPPLAPAKYLAPCAAVEDETETGDDLKQLSTVGFVVGGLAAIGTVVFYFASGSSSETTAQRVPSRSVALSPWLGPGTGGVVLRGEL